MANTYLEGLKKVALGSYNQKRAVADQKIRDAARKSRRIAEAKQNVIDASSTTFDLSDPKQKEAAAIYLSQQANQNEVVLPTE